MTDHTAPVRATSPVGNRVLVTGVSTFLGERIARELAGDPRFDLVVGTDAHAKLLDVSLESGRTEVVACDLGFADLARLIRTTEIDTVVAAHGVADSTRLGERALHENNVIGTMNLLAAAGAPGSQVRCLVVLSSTAVYGSTERDPYWFTEDQTRSRPATTRVEKSLLEAEAYFLRSVEENPAVDAALLRIADVLGPGRLDSGRDSGVSRLLERPLVPAVAGFDPLVQFVEERDTVRAVLFAIDRRLRGVFNVAADGRMPWSECVSVAGSRLVPALPPYLTERAGAVIGSLRRTVDLPPELLAFLRHGRGVDNRRLRDAGFRYRCTSAETMELFGRAKRRRRVVGPSATSVLTERALDAVLRQSGAFRRRDGREGRA